MYSFALLPWLVRLDSHPWLLIHEEGTKSSGGPGVCTPASHVARRQGFRTTEALNKTKGEHLQPTQTSALVPGASSYEPGELPRPKPSPEAKRMLRSLPPRGERVLLLGDRRTKVSQGLVREEPMAFSRGPRTCTSSETVSVHRLACIFLWAG